MAFASGVPCAQLPPTYEAVALERDPDADVMLVKLASDVSPGPVVPIASNSPAIGQMGVIAGYGLNDRDTAGERLFVKSTIEAVGRARERCWKFDWVLDLDVRSFFDSLDHGLVMRAVGRYSKSRWIHLYVERWLKAPVQLEDGTLEARISGTPQGGVVSPLLANIFLHLTFDAWMQLAFTSHCIWPLRH